MTQHPAAVAAQSLAVAKAAEKKLRAEKEVALTKQHGLRFLHIRDDESFDFDLQIRAKPHGGCTLAYTFAGKDRVNVAVATCHKIDLYSKPIGRLQAAENYDKGRYVSLRIPKGLSPVQFLQITFLWSARPTA
jgi:hypothetical protein